MMSIEKQDKGMRYFVSKYPELTITMIPEEPIIINGKTVKQKAKRVLFKKEVKPRILRGIGMLGTNNPDGTDRNNSVYWGVFYTDDQKVINFLRGHEFYRTTRQDNKVEREMKLKELDWDPSGMARSGVALSATKASFSEKDLETAAPGDAPGSPPKAKVGLTKK